MIFGKTVNKYYLKYAHLFLLGVVALIFVDYFQLEIPALTGELIDKLVDGNIDKSGLFDILSLIALYVSIIIVGRFFWRLFIFGASRRVDYGIRNEMFSHTEKLSNRFYSENKVGGLMAYFTNDLESVRRAIGPGMIMSVDAVFLGGLAFSHMLNLDVRLTLYSGIPLIIIAMLGAYIGNKMRNKFKEAQKAFEELSDFTNESLSGISVVKAFVKEQTEIKEFLKFNKIAKDKNIEYVKMQTIFQVTVRTVISIIFVVILAYGGYLVKVTASTSEPFTIGELWTFIMLFGALIWPMMALAMIINIRSRGRASLERIDRILHEEIDIYDKDVIDIEEIKGEIEFKDLFFKYPDGTENALQNISFKVQVGETIGILGRTGSGKTSIVDLLLRIYNVEENKLFIDGIDIMRLPIKKVRSAVGYVPQDGFLFSDSISNNISLGLQKRVDVYKEIQEAAKLSDVHDNIIEFTDGYETVIGERGVTLSGGQKQRLSIARALIKDPAILILDDSISAVDTQTEDTILSNLKKVRKGKTTLIIAHRISTIKDADKIIIVEEGKVVDVGTHDELITRCAFYKDIVERQKLEEETEVE
ncbi:MAG: ABC transporter ATP-binding protein [Candidatus Izimaplasma sp.]|nr:ABC transporter ATP-binding protein [Candidatus Izimaplasma bacterium]